MKLNTGVLVCRKDALPFYGRDPEPAFPGMQRQILSFRSFNAEKKSVAFFLYREIQRGDVAGYGSIGIIGIDARRNGTFSRIGQTVAGAKDSKDW
jgi:hypothetical protein